MEAVLLFALALLAQAPASADTEVEVSPAGGLNELKVLVGMWESPDGFARASFKLEPDTDWMSTRMWFKDGDSWKQVSFGGIYRQPITGTFISVSKTNDMERIVLFESEMRPTKDGFATIHNVYRETGEVTWAQEDWVFSAPDKFEYKVYRLVGGEKHPLLGGVWQRVDVSVPDDNIIKE